MRIAVDQDQVICKWVERVLEWYNEDYKTNFTRDDIKNYWAMQDILGVQGKPFIRAAMRYPEMYRDLDEVEGAIAGMKSLTDLGYDVVIATAVPRSAGIAYHGKLEWLRRRMPWFNLDNFIAIQRKDLLAADVLIDDGPHNIEAWVKSGRECIIFDAPWNQGIKESDFVYRAKNWDEVLARIKRIDELWNGFEE